MSPFPTILFLGGMVLASIPTGILAWYLRRSWKPATNDADTLSHAIFWVSLAHTFLYLAQLTSVALSVVGLSYQARTPVIFLIDGSLLVVTVASWYAFFKVRDIYGHIKNKFPDV